MIRVRKPDLAPPILRERGAALTAELCSKAEAGEPLGFDRDIYAAEEVKQALRAATTTSAAFASPSSGMRNPATSSTSDRRRPRGRARRVQKRTAITDWHTHGRTSTCRVRSATDDTSETSSRS